MLINYRFGFVVVVVVVVVVLSCLFVVFVSEKSALPAFSPG